MPKHPGFLPKKPQGAITRGKTAQNRLRQTDHFLMIYDPALLRQSGPSIFVDLGYGFGPVTTIETADRFHRLNPELRILGVEIDPERVAAAMPFQTSLVSFRLGGFNIPVQAGEKVRGIRAFNVLRQYNEDDVAQAWEAMGHNVIEGGLLLEGTSNPVGNIWVSNVLRLRGGVWKQEALVFYRGLSNLALNGFDPADFQPVLPKNLIHRMVPGEWVNTFFEDWKKTAQETAHQKAWGAKRWFGSSVEALAQRGYPIMLQKKYLNRGFMVVRLEESAKAD